MASDSAAPASVLVAGAGGGSKLKTQDLSKLNISELNPLSPEVISRQATINIGARPAPSAFFFHVERRRR